MKRRTDHNRNPFVVITDYFRNQFIYCVDFNKRLKQRAADLDLLWSPLTRSLWCSTGRAVTHAASNSCVRLSTLTHSSTHKYNLTMNQERCESACLGLLQDKAMDTKLPKSPAGSQRSAQPCNALSALWQQICTQSYPLYAHTYCIHPGLQIQFAFSHLTNAPHARTNKSAGAVTHSLQSIIRVLLHHTRHLSYLPAIRPHTLFDNEEANLPSTNGWFIQIFCHV